MKIQDDASVVSLSNWRMVLPSLVIRKAEGLSGNIMSYTLDILHLRDLLDIHFEMSERQLQRCDWSSAESLGQERSI